MPTAQRCITFGKPLRYSLKGARRLRVGDWRVIYTIEPPGTVLVVKIGRLGRQTVWARVVSREEAAGAVKLRQARAVPTALAGALR